MADELQINLNVRIQNDPLFDLIQESFSLTMSAIELASGIQVVGTSAEAVVTTDVSTLGWCYMKNLDSTNFVEYGPDDGGTMKDFGMMKPGEPALFRLTPGITMKVKADTAPCKVLYKIYGD